MRSGRILIIILIGLLSAILGYFGYERWFLKKDVEATVSVVNEENKEVEQLKDSIPVEYEVPVDKEWRISFDEPLDENTIRKDTVFVQDKSGKEVDVPISLLNNNQTVSIKAPPGGYQKGEYYELHMTDAIAYPDGKHVSKYFKQGFIIVRDAAETGVYNKNVKTLEKSAVLSTTDKVITLDKSKVTAEDIKKDNILVIPTDKDVMKQQAIKVKESKEEGQTYLVTYTIPEFSELYEKLDIYKTYNLDSGNVQFIPENGIDSELVSIVGTNTSIAASGSNRKKASGNGEFSFDKDSSIEAVFKNKGIEIVLKDLNVDMKGYNAKLDGTYRLFSPKFHYDVDIDWGDIERFNSYFTYYHSSEIRSKLTLSKKELKSIKELAKKKKSSWVLEKEVLLGKLIVPTAIPGLFVVTDLSLVVGLGPDGEVKGTLTLEKFVNVQISPKIGLVTKNKEVEPVFEVNPQIDAGIMAKGEAKGKLTAELQVGLEAFNLIGVALEGEAGGYAEGSFNIGTATTDDTLACGKYEYGLLASGKAIVDAAWDEELVSARLAELKYALDVKNSCEELKGISVSPETLTLKPGDKVELKVNGLFTDKSTGTEIKKSILEGKFMEKISIETADSGVADVHLREYAKHKFEPGGAVKKNELKLTLKGIPTKAFKATIEVPKDVSSDETTIDVSYENFHVEIPVKIDGVQKPVEEKEAKQLVEKAFDGINRSFQDLGEQYGWDRDTNPVDFDILKQELAKYATTSLINSKLEDVAEDYYCSCDAYHYPSPKLDVRFALTESRPNRFVVKSAEFSNMINDKGAHVTITMKKEKEKWLLDNWKVTSYKNKPLNITWDEAKIYLKELGIDSEYVKKAKYRGREILIYKDLTNNRYAALYTENGEELGEVPEELIAGNRNSSKATIPDVDLLEALGDNDTSVFHINKSKEFLISNFGEPIKTTEDSDSKLIDMEYRDAIYRVFMEEGYKKVVDVTIKEERVSSYSFDQIIKKFGEPQDRREEDGLYVLSYGTETYLVNFYSSTRTGEKLNKIVYVINYS